MDVSIIVRTKNEEEGIREVLQKIFLQKTDKEYEVIVVDSGSTDSTLEVLSEYECKIISIPPDKFTYGYSLNLGFRNAKGDYLVYLSAHSPPIDEYWLDNLLKPFSNKEVAAVFGRQIPRRGVDPFEEWYTLKLFPEDKNAKLAKGTFSNANAAIRREVCQMYPFDEKLRFAEDRKWAREVSSKHIIVYEPQSAVYHSHKLTFESLAERMYNVGYSGKEVLGKKCKWNSLWYMALAFIYLAARDFIYFIKNKYLTYIPRIFRYRYVYISSMLKGARDFQGNL